MTRMCNVLSTTAVLAFCGVTTAGAQGSMAGGGRTYPTPMPSREFAVAVAAGSDAVRGFSVTLVQGEAQGSSSFEGLPPAAAKALADMKDFLPYKRYTLLDSQWTLGSGRIRNLLRSPDGHTYELEMQAQLPFGMGQTPQPNSALLITEFHLRDAGTGAATVLERGNDDDAKVRTEAAARSAELTSLEARLAELQSKGLAPQHPESLDVAKRLSEVRSAQMQMKAATARIALKDSIIDTSFRMNVGETVVVGTSRLQGDKALIILLTAVGK